MNITTRGSRNPVTVGDGLYTLAFDSGTLFTMSKQEESLASIESNTNNFPPGPNTKVTKHIPTTQTQDGKDAAVRVRVGVKSHKAAHETVKHPQVPVALVVDQKGHVEDIEQVHLQSSGDAASSGRGDGCHISLQSHNEDVRVCCRQVVALQPLVHPSAVLDCLDRPRQRFHKGRS